MYLNVYHKPYCHSTTYMHLTKNAQRTTDNNIVQTRVGDRAGWPAAKHPVYLALVYPTNKHMAELQREPSCSIVSQLTVTSYKNRNTGVKISLVWYGAAS